MQKTIVYEHNDNDDGEGAIDQANIATDMSYTPKMKKNLKVRQYAQKINLMGFSVLFNCGT